MPPLAAYLRVSRVGDRTETLISPQVQLDRIHQYVEGRGIVIVELEPELDVSGSKFHRPVLDRILRGIEAGEFGGLIVSQQDRLSRMGILDTLRLIDRIESLGGRFVSVAEDIDGSTRSGKLTRNLFSSIAEHELDRYREQFREAKERAVKAGVWPSPRVPLGYRRGADRRLVPEQEHRVRAAFERRAAGAAWSEVAHLLDRPISTTRQILHNRVYLGEVRMGEFVNRKAHEPIVSRALFEAAQLPHPPSTWKPNPALLSGIIRCAGCRGRMTATKNSRGSLYYRCQGKPRVGGKCAERATVRREVADAYVERVVFAHLGRVSISVRERTKAVEDAAAELGEAESELETFQEVVRVSEIGRDNFLAGMRSRVEAVEVARRNLANLRVDTPVPSDFAWSDLSVLEKRHVLSRSLGVVWCKQGGHLRVVTGEFKPPAHGAPVVPLDWPDTALENEIGMTG